MTTPEDNNTSANQAEQDNAHLQDNEEQNIEQRQFVTIEQMTDVELFEQGLEMLRSSSAKNKNAAEYYRYLQVKYFGEDVSEEEATNATLEDERQQALVADFLQMKLSGIKSDAISLDTRKINGAFENVFSLVQLELDAEKTSENWYDKIFMHRVAQIPDLMVDYKIMQLNRNMAALYASKSGTAELNSYIMDMEDYYSNDDINREQLAQFYYNVGMIYEVNSVQKNTSQAVYREHYMALSYERKALEMTNTNINLILNVHKDWHDNFDYNPQKILDACHRVIDSSSDPRDVYRAHKLYAETLLDFKGTDGFSSKREERMASVIKHYRSALEYTQNKEEKIDVLNAISEQQKIADKAAYVQTRLEMAELMSGRARIREYEHVARETGNDELKVSLLKAGINEFHELEAIDDEDRRLYTEIDEKLRVALPQDEKSEVFLAQLDKLKERYGLAEKKKIKSAFSIASSAGHDYFS